MGENGAIAQPDSTSDAPPPAAPPPPAGPSPLAARTPSAARTPAAALSPPAARTLPAAPSAADLARFYERSYSGQGEDGMLYARWRTLGAIGKADHVVALCARTTIEPASVLDVGCGDGALLAELAERSFGGRLCGVEISQTAFEIARGRPQIDAVETYDGQTLRARTGEYDLGILSHVLEHVPAPAPLLREVARACKAVVVEVPLEGNLSARRTSKRRHAEEVGHLQRLTRGAARAIVADAGLDVAAEIEDALPLTVHLFFAGGRAARAKARVKWATRAALHRFAPPLARRLFTVHYACLCLPRR
jgi:SAM-dependent methyltransferase